MAPSRFSLNLLPIPSEELNVLVADSTAIHEFEGTSSLGCLADKSDITLTRSPGGPLGTLLVVVGKGTIHEERY
jgi:hypothetical protein